MDPEHVINLFDSYWFNYEILKKKPSVSSVKTDESEVKFSSLRSILVRSQSEDIGNSFNYGSFSPNSVLKTIPSGQLDFTTQKQEQVEQLQQVEQAQELPEIIENKDHQMEVKKKKNRKRRSGMSKSLSDLEFEELKGFMDMGFVFSEQDSKDSNLVEIIPGLQRLGLESQKEEDDNENDDENEDEDEDEDDDKDSILYAGERRPYLSEAWDEMDKKLKKKEFKITSPMKNWEIPAFKDEIDMKDNLKLWAHTVASYVR